MGSKIVDEVGKVDPVRLVLAREDKEVIGSCSRATDVETHGESATPALFDRPTRILEVSERKNGGAGGVKVGAAKAGDGAETVNGDGGGVLERSERNGGTNEVGKKCGIRKKVGGGAVVEHDTVVRGTRGDSGGAEHAEIVRAFISESGGGEGDTARDRVGEGAKRWRGRTWWRNRRDGSARRTVLVDEAGKIL